MKTFYKFLTLIFATALFAAGCVNETPAYMNEKPEPSTPANGFLALGGMSMRVVYDTENGNDDTGDQTQRPTSRATRAQPDVDMFWVELFDAKDVSLFKKQYADLKVELTEEKMELPVGTYRLEVYSDQTIPDVEWDYPTYGASKPLTIDKGLTANIGEVVCMLSNIKVTLMCAADLSARLNLDKTKATISLGDTKTDFTIGETRAAYFKATELSNTIKFQLQGEFTDGKAVKFSKSINNIKAGQWRKISLVIDYADKGDIKFDIQVEGFEQDEEIVVDGTSGKNGWEPIFSEEPVIDPDAPLILWPGHSLLEPFQLTTSMFDAQGNCIEPFTLDVEAPRGIETFTLDITSTSPEYMANLASLGISGPLDLTNFDTSSAAYVVLDNIFHFPMNDKLKGKTSVDFNLGKAMPMLYDFNGTHTFALTVTDINGLESLVELALVVDKNNEADGPVIEWVGYDLSKVYSLDEVESIVVNVTAEAGIKSFVVEIDSEALKGLLNGVGMNKLTAPFDLCTIDGAEKGFLAGIGFKTGGEIKDQTSAGFDITQFISILAGLESDNGGGPNSYNFRFTVTDNNGKTTNGAIQLVQPSK